MVAVSHSPMAMTPLQLASASQSAACVHLSRGGVEDQRRDADQRHRHRSLQRRGEEGEDDAAFQRAVARHHVGGDDRLAVARPGGVEDAVGETETDEAPDRRRIAVQRMHFGGDQPRQLRLHFDQPAGEPAAGAAAALAAADHERALRKLGEGRRRGERQTRRREARAPRGAGGTSEFMGKRRSRGSPS